MLEAVIFDMDGVLVDSYRAHFESWRALAAEHGLTMTEAQFAESFGRTSREIVSHLWQDRLSANAIEEMDRRKELLYREVIAREFPVMEGAVELIDALADEKIPLAVGSSGPPENVVLVLDRLGRRHHFGAVVTGLDVTRGKPDPQVFQVAAERLRAPAAGCVVIEDAPSGIEAARRAGMKSVALLSTGRKREDFWTVVPHLVIASLCELDPPRIRSLTD